MPSKGVVNSGASCFVTTMGAGGLLLGSVIRRPPSLDVVGPAAAPPPDGAAGRHKTAATPTAARLPKPVLPAPSPACSVWLGVEKPEKKERRGMNAPPPKSTTPLKWGMEQTMMLPTGGSFTVLSFDTPPLMLPAAAVHQTSASVKARSCQRVRCFCQQASGLSLRHRNACDVRSIANQAMVEFLARASCRTDRARNGSKRSLRSGLSMHLSSTQLASDRRGLLKLQLIVAFQGDLGPIIHSYRR